MLYAVAVQAGQEARVELGYSAAFAAGSNLTRWARALKYHEGYLAVLIEWSPSPRFLGRAYDVVQECGPRPSESSSLGWNPPCVGCC